MANGARHPGSFSVRRPDRSVSLPSPELQRAGFGVFDWGGYGNPPEIWTRGPGGPDWNITSNAEARRFLEAVAEQMRKDGRDDAPPPGTSLEEVVGPVYDYLGKSPRHIALPEEGGITDNVPEPGEGEAVDPERDPEPVYEPQPDRGPMLATGEGPQSQNRTSLFNYLMDRTGARDFFQDPTSTQTNLVSQAALLAGSAAVGGGFGAGSGGGGGIRGALNRVRGGGMRGGSGMAGLNPQSQMSQTMLADRFAQQRAQPQQGYFGSTGAAIGGMAGGVNKAVQGMTNRAANMSNTERAALVSALIGAGLITYGSGGMLAPVGYGLLGGAALSGQP